MTDSTFGRITLNIGGCKMDSVGKKEFLSGSEALLRFPVFGYLRIYLRHDP